LKDNTDQNALRTIGQSVGLSAVVYSMVGIFGCLLMGENIKISIVGNIAEEKSAISVAIQSVFIIVLACHIPYNFYVVKECLLTMVDEANRKSLS
jgi:hypothetical protein